jgi:hypothetical protein
MFFARRRQIFPLVSLMMLIRVESLPPVSTISAENCQRFSTSFANVVDTSGNFATSINDTGGKFVTGVNNTGGKQWEQLSNC